MIERVAIKDNKRSPLHYLPEIEAFKNGAKYLFKPGVNVIVGENGCGKTTLMKLIECYLLVDKEECSLGIYNSVINRLTGLKESVPVGIDVYADYRKNTFRLCHAGQKGNDDVMESFSAFGTHFTQLHSSTGEGVTIALNAMFKRMFGADANLVFDYDAIGKKRPDYGKYVNKHRVEEHDEYTILMDEPDRNLDIEHIGEIEKILSFHKDRTQIVAVVHNPLLICALSKNPEVNIIEMTPGYVNRIKKLVKKYAK